MRRAIFGVVVQPGPDGTRLILLEREGDFFTCPNGVPEVSEPDYVFLNAKLVRFIPEATFIRPKFFHYLSNGDEVSRTSFLVDLKGVPRLVSTPASIWTSAPEQLPLNPATVEIVAELRRLNWF